ncbi:hypothetical protein [Candidatus Tisiphia endosymbiont of Mystacides longicornis]|uniref:hypothetical protein n=1 Tax=Candidatus Tisiphia endosymbiont of Mystacides longicornis TaxID=3139330 RepID=UPI003CCB0472
MYIIAKLRKLVAMLNLIQGRLVIVNPANITPNSQMSISEKVTLQHYVIARRRKPTKQSKKVIRFGLFRRSKATPRNDFGLIRMNVNLI